MRFPLVATPTVAMLLTLAIPAPASEQDIRNNIALGALAFSDNCARCHRIDGYGEESLYPSLHNPQLLHDKALLIQTLLRGRTGHQQNSKGQVTLMPSLNFLSDSEIVAIIAFISNSWGDEVLMVTEQEVRDARSAMDQGVQDSGSE